MPLYEYECLDCVTTFEARRSFERSSEPAQCPSCRGTQTHKIFTTPAFINLAGHSSRGELGDQAQPHGGCGCGAGACGCRHRG